jgi:hypothetical protein
MKTFRYQCFCLQVEFHTIRTASRELSLETKCLSGCVSVMAVGITPSLYSMEARVFESFAHLRFSLIPNATSLVLDLLQKSEKLMLL